jgi:predicted DNA-binding protein
MDLSIRLPEEQSARLADVARRLGVDPLELARAAVADLLSRGAEDFDHAAEHVLRKNAELYRRLS